MLGKISTHALTWSATSGFRSINAIIAISTHALTWSATHQYTRAIPSHSEISTHALTWSATISSALSPSDCNFNSRTHVECDPMDTGIIKSPPPISTHALTWSATISEGTGKIFCYISTHALTWSATDAIRKGGTRLCDFNSRTHVECDLL